MSNLIYLTIILLGLAGFAVALKISIKKRDKKPMVCPLNMKCDQVLYSKYSKFLGIPLEFLGMLYYSLVVISYFGLLFYPEIIAPNVILTIFISTIGGFMFSVYLISIQMFRLREWCSWCLISSGISTTIFILALQPESINNILVPLIYKYETLLIIIYALAVSIGLGLVVIMEVLFFRFLRDLVISDEECNVLHTLRQAVWFAIGIMVISKYLFYLMNPQLALSSIKFLITTFILAILTIINIIYDLFISSRLIEIFSSNNNGIQSAGSFLRIMPFILGPISLASYLLIFIFELTKNPKIYPLEFLGLYLVMSLIVTIFGIILAKITLRR